MGKDVINEAVKDARRWKIIAIVSVLVAVLALWLPYIHPSEQTEIGPIAIDNETHGVYQIATVSIESGKVSAVEKGHVTKISNVGKSN